MSDGYISIVPSEIELEHPQVKAQQVTQWLIAKEIVAATQTDCVLGSPVGYPPGPRFRDALNPGENHGGFPELVTNGVKVITGRRVFDTGGNGIEEVRCPKCQDNIIDSDWGDFLGEWVNGGSQFMQCPNCGQESLLTEYDFNIEKRFIWAFSNFGVTFWNWPPEFKDSFIAELEQVIGSSVRIVYGRL